MGAAVDIADMIHRGGVFEVEGKNQKKVKSLDKKNRRYQDYDKAKIIR